MGSSSLPCMVLSCPIPSSSRTMRKTFSLHPCPLGLHKAPPCLIKLYFLLIYPITSTFFFFFMKPISLIKIYLKLKLNLSHQIKSIFKKIKLNNIFNFLIRQSHKKKKKKKSHSITHNKIKAKNHIW